ncbi:MAG TPA: isocitrate lyase/phosphoenolpyruvate mutase family protein, partial [Mycobacterium sp.]|nr:isocitrate lyase/phosphoenolpyruvate mutase family protein [Mycobacterium sp.]
AAGQPDTPTAVGVDAVLGNIAGIVGAVDLPVNADFQAGYSDDLEGVAVNVARCVATGVAGLSIEDASGRTEEPLYSLPEAVERVRVARSAIDQSGADVLLTARAECFLYDHPDALREAITRLQAFADAGADVLYAPGLRTREDIASLVDALHPHPVNVLMGSATGLTVSELGELGVRRVSVGSALSRVAWGAFLSAARQIADAGRFDGLAPAANFGELNQLFA